MKPYAQMPNLRV
ncbi:hypothetical protein Ahy_A02g005849 isoform E [Arachis hypogaea]|uniref:Uncharacterized protein n=1 Tax=Arachis hypogaea TaxID=3818 RepID=A0A445E865_ARAHY|nr:hypothetical protein Ahy_A02g005849 isoform E [Arachis hypogaea]